MNRGSRTAPDWVILTLACVAQFMVVLDVSIVNVALPAMRLSLGFSQSGLQWVVNAYTLTFAGFLLLGGRAADLYGRRKIFMLGLLVFVGASLLGGLAQNQAWLITARAVQGLGGASLSPATLTILTTTFTEPKARSKAMGLWSAVAGAGGAAGALLGGILTQELSWRWILFINVPIGLAALLAAGAFLQETRAGGERQPLDVAGAVLVTGGLTSFVYGLVRTTDVGWTSWQTLLALSLALVLIAGFLLHESRIAKAPLMPLPMFERHSVWSSNMVMLLLAGSIFSMWFFISLYMQEVLGYSPLKTGFAFLPQTFAIIVGAQLSSRILLKVGPRLILVVGGASTALGLFWLAQVGVSSAYWTAIFVPSLFITFGLGISFTPLAFVATSGVPPREAGLASGLVNTSRQIGGAIALAALATIATSTTASAAHAFARSHPAASRASLAHELASAMTKGYTKSFFISGFIAVAAMFGAGLIPKFRRPGEEAVVAAPSPGAERLPQAALDDMTGTTIGGGVPEPVLNPAVVDG